MKKVLLLQNGEARKSQQKIIKTRVEESGYSFRVLDIEKEKGSPTLLQQIEAWIAENQKPIATIRWDEHSNVFGKSPRIQEVSTWGWNNNVAPIAIDFSYFNHYSGFIFDLLDSQGQSSIKREWDEVENDLIPLVDFGGPLGDYIRLIKRIYQKHDYFKSLRHTTANYDVLAWTQCLVNNCRILKTNKPDVWIEQLHEIFGASILFKIQPSPFNDKEIKLDKYRTLYSNAGSRKIMNHSVELNASLACNARVNITNTSGITSELLIAQKPVITTGESWFTDLGVFYEAKSWGHLKDLSDNHIEEEIPESQTFNRLKLANWWRKHQVLHNEKSQIISDCIKEFKDKKIS